MKKTEKQAIAVVSFGTSYPDALKNSIQACEREIARACPDREVRRAFTSRIIRRKLKERDGLEIPDLPGLLEQLLSEGFTDVAVQPLHLLAGEEFHEKIVAPAASFRSRFESLTISRPFFSGDNDFLALKTALQEDYVDIPKGSALLLMGHGSSHPADAAYSKLQHRFFRDRLPFFVATVEGYPSLEDTLPFIEAAGLKSIILLPLMLVAGDHARNDMAGDAEDSWKSILQSRGYEVTVVMKGLGEDGRIRKVFLEHLAEALAGGA